MAQSVDIPLNLTYSSSGVLLTINVGIGGQAPQSYIFDTGSQVFLAQYSSAAFGSVPSSMNGLPTGVSQIYGCGCGYTYNLVGVPSLTFYPTATSTSGGVTLNAVTPSGAASTFTIGAITADQNISVPDSPVAGVYGGDYGVFGAGNFAYSATGTNNITVTTGGVLGQAVVPGTTAGYVVAANGQPLSSLNTGGSPVPEASVNGPQVVGQSVTSCSPCVMTGLTPALLAQFAPVNTMAASPGQAFPNSDAPSSNEYGITTNVSLSAPGQTTLSWHAPTLLDTGTNSYYVNGGNSLNYAPYGGATVNPGTTLTVGGTAIIVNQQSNSPYNTFTNSQTNSNLIGLGFFLQNSVLYNLAGQVVALYAQFRDRHGHFDDHRLAS
jgi:hypothetical protein